MKLVDDFQRLFGQAPRLFRAPGRVNLIGEHTDYNDGFVMPAPLEFATTVAAAPRTDGLVVLHSRDFPQEEVTFELAELRPGTGHHWADYVRGVAYVLRRRFPGLRGAHLLVEGNVPIGAGLSSSASVEVASALALLGVSEIAAPPGPELARLCQSAENEYVGMRCGIMDQFVSCCGQAGHALMLDCRSLEFRQLPLATEARLVIVNSGVKHALAGGEYNQRRASCEAGAAQLGVSALRDATLPAVEELLDPILRRRCRHVVSENQRVLDAAAALERGDLSDFGRLMVESHESLRVDYEVSCNELDLMVNKARQQPGVFGARMTGGGFGGCTVNLVRAEHVDSFRKAMAPLVSYACEIGAGASEVKG